MTNTHLFYDLRMLADDALSMLEFGKFDRAHDALVCLLTKLDNEYERACDEECPDIPDDVDESNYNPYMGCDDYDYNPADIGWDV